MRGKLVNGRVVITKGDDGTAGMEGKDFPIFKSNSGKSQIVIDKEKNPANPTNPAKTIPERPATPCYACGSMAWYWPGDYYFGPKSWICSVCHPAPIDDLTGANGARELPDCPKCGNNGQWVGRTDGNYQCSCGSVLRESQ
jgi:hypothetical protein